MITVTLFGRRIVSRRTGPPFWSLHSVFLPWSDWSPGAPGNFPKHQSAQVPARPRNIATYQTPFVHNCYAGEFVKHVGVELSPITVPYPVYVFEYVSAGGNSSQRTTVTLNRETIDAMIETMSKRIRFRKSVAGQRALMTSKLRTMIKERDRYTYRYCSISLEAEPHLLLRGAGRRVGRLVTHTDDKIDAQLLGRARMSLAEIMKKTGIPKASLRCYLGPADTAVATDDTVDAGARGDAE
ncbi:hypothetical protein [Nocardia brasiliensis]|uniref:hypothetical protein n=1 Tax=Nocardia brasiliensis TaxID=37326 RepID=UPI0024584428|nr:hypothetical protein [Nocardia brasiliensis]